jgi:hypothetical protein
MKHFIGLDAHSKSCTFDDLSAKEYIVSDRLDYDHLSS